MARMCRLFSGGVDSKPTVMFTGSMKNRTGRAVPVTTMELSVSNTRGQQINFFDILHVYGLTIGIRMTPGLEEH